MSDTTPANNVKVGVVMGSSSDWDVMRHAADILTEFGIPFEAQVVSAHRMPDDMFRYAEAAADRGLVAIIYDADRFLGLITRSDVLTAWRNRLTK